MTNEPIKPNTADDHSELSIAMAAALTTLSKCTGIRIITANVPNGEYKQTCTIEFEIKGSADAWKTYEAEKAEWDIQETMKKYNITRNEYDDGINRQTTWNRKNQGWKPRDDFWAEIAEEKKNNEIIET